MIITRYKNELGALIGPITRNETIHGLGCLLNNQFKARYRGVNIKWTMTRRREGLYRMKIYENLAIVKCFGEGKNMCLENVLNQALVSSSTICLFILKKAILALILHGVFGT